jgi:hypothetical protein
MTGSIALIGPLRGQKGIDSNLLVQSYPQLGLKFRLDKSKPDNV